jgi:hypothetical protein
MHLSREHRKLLIGGGAAALVPGLLLGVLIGRSAAEGWLLGLFLFSCVLVGLAQQTIP